KTLRGTHCPSSLLRHGILLEGYLVGQLLESSEKRFEALREFYPNAEAEDWKVEVAGQRAQIIKKDPVRGGVLELGTQLVSASDGSIAGMLGASPGASTAACVMLQVIERCFADELKTGGSSSKLKQMIPTYGQSLIANPEL